MSEQSSPEAPRRRRRWLPVAAIALAASMEGLITDDNGQVIASDALDFIGADLEDLYDTLDARDLSAGSPQARRLFS